MMMANLGKIMAVLVSILLLIFKQSYSAPHTSVCEIGKKLTEKGLSGITSRDDFTKSVYCVACGVAIRPEGTVKMVWMLAKHSQLETHKNKAGWYLDNERNVVEYRPKGKQMSVLFKCNRQSKGFSKEKEIT